MLNLPGERKWRMFQGNIIARIHAGRSNTFRVSCSKGCYNGHSAFLTRFAFGPFGRTAAAFDLSRLILSDSNQEWRQKQKTDFDFFRWLTEALGTTGLNQNADPVSHLSRPKNSDLWGREEITSSCLWQNRKLSETSWIGSSLEQNFIPSIATANLIMWPNLPTARLFFGCSPQVQRVDAWLDSVKGNDWAPNPLHLIYHLYHFDINEISR